MHLHFCLALQYWGEEAACRQFRKVVPGYAEHFPGPARWAQRCQSLSTVEDYREMVRELAPRRAGWELETTDAAAWRALLRSVEAQTGH
ncbi:MAG: hypothetical protein HC901_01955 [Bdellovibrionaceae bacterium]|nr:hypothetical protein [Pseudobdellovibrionaceae bacterium]